MLKVKIQALSYFIFPFNLKDFSCFLLSLRFKRKIKIIFVLDHYCLMWSISVTAGSTFGFYHLLSSFGPLYLCGVV